MYDQANVPRLEVDFCHEARREARLVSRDDFLVGDGSITQFAVRSLSLVFVHVRDFTFGDEPALQVVFYSWSSSLPQLWIVPCRFSSTRDFEGQRDGCHAGMLDQIKGW